MSESTPERVTDTAATIYIDAASAELLAKVLRDTAAESAPTDHPVDQGFRAGIECAAQTIEQIAKACAVRRETVTVPLDHQRGSGLSTPPGSNDAA